MHWTVGVVCWAAVALALAFAICRMLGLWTHTASWIRSSKEEKANLTRSGIYNANGFMIKGEIDDYNGGSYHHLDMIDVEYPMTTMTIFPINHRESEIPPQPLRPAPIIIPQESRTSNYFKETTVTLDDQDKSDSFYHYNISTAITKPFVSEEVEDNPIEKLDDIVILDGGAEEDWTMRNNLNIFKKPAYRSTNPFLSNGNQANGQFNPFFSRANSQDNLMDKTMRYNELTNECDLNLQNSVTRSNLIRKRSFDYDYEIDDTIANDPIITVVGNTTAVKRAISCDSVSSDTSLGPLESPLPIITGQLCLSLRCFRVNSDETLLAVNVIEARNLEGDCPDTYVGIFFSPVNKEYFKTKICHETNCPSYNETFIINIGKTNKKLCFHIYNVKNDACSLIGEAELSLQDAGSYKQPVTTWLTLTDTGHGLVEYGELMLSLSYLPTAERLTLILTRARRLPDPTDFNIFIKVYLQKNGKKVGKKRSSIKRSEFSPTFNEAFIFSVPPHLLSSVELRVTLVYFPIGIEFSSIATHKKIGHIVLSRDAYGKAGNHWNQMILSLRKPVSMWHVLRKQHT
ncbi:synaptotagmin 12 [Arctopsyche grandis]|uniref:synaptotagmin 12 n=1 Tax=Arctopsyche grandis TaxID=121162 RepID=UPI00406D83E4